MLLRRWIWKQVNKYVADLQSEINALINANPQTPEEQHQIFILKKRAVDMVLAEARIDANREIHVKFRMDLLNFVGHDFESGSKGQTKEIDKPFHANQIGAVV